MAKKTRIIERTYGDGTVKFILQQKYFLFPFIWVDANINSREYIQTHFKTLEEAVKMVPYIDGSADAYTDKVVKYGK